MGKSFLFALLTNALFLGLFLLVFQPGYNTNDDPGMWFEASGTFKDAGEFGNLLFSNFLASKFLTAFNVIDPNFPWYSIFLYGLQFICFTIFGTLLIRRAGVKQGGILFLVLLFTVAVHFYIYLQFTLTSTLLAIAGMVLLIQSVKKKELESWRDIKLIFGTIVKSKETWLGIGLIVISSLIRFKSALLVCLIFICIAVMMAVIIKAKYIHLIIPAVVALGCVWALEQTNAAYWKSDPDLKFAYELNRTRGLVSGNGLFKNATVEEKERILSLNNWSYNDFRMLDYWYFSDRTTFSKESFQVILDTLPNLKRVSFLELKRSIISFFRRPFVVSVSVSLLMLLLLLKLERRELLMALAIGPFIFAVILFITFKYRLPPLRVSLPLVTLAPTFILTCIVSQFDTIRMRMPNILLSLGLLILISIANFKYIKEISDRNVINQEKFEYSIKEIKNLGTGNLFIFWAGVIHQERIDPFKSLDYLDDIDGIIFGSQQVLPSSYATAKKYQIENVLLDIVDRDDVYILIPKSDAFKLVIKTYLQEHYNVKTEFEELYVRDHYRITKLKSI